MSEGEAVMEVSEASEASEAPEAPAETSKGQETTKAQAARFVSVGVLNTGIDFALFNLLHFIVGLAIPVANVISVSAAIANSFAWNKLWTFHDRRTKGVFGQVGLFVVVSLVGLLINTGAVHLLTDVWVGPRLLLGSILQGVGVGGTVVEVITVNAAKAFAVAATMTWNFVGYKVLVFRRPQGV